VSGFEEAARPNELGQLGAAIDLADDARGRLCFVFADPRGIAQVTVVDEAGVLAPAGTRVARNYGPYPGWRPVAVAAGPSRTFALLWRHDDRRASVWRLEAFGGFISGAEFGPFPGWTPTDVSIGGDDNSRLLWAHTNGFASIWVVNAAGAFVLGREYGPFPGWTPRAISTGLDSQSRLIWNHTDTRGSLWYLDPAAGFISGAEYQP
jgi:hypothetical protein